MSAGVLLTYAGASDVGVSVWREYLSIARPRVNKPQMSGRLDLGLARCFLNTTLEVESAGLFFFLYLYCCVTTDASLLVVFLNLL